MLHGVLNMPPNLWCGSPIDIAQRHSRYKEASQRIRQLERELAEVKETIEMLETRHGATMFFHQMQMNEVTKQRDALAEALREMLKFTPRSLSCQDFHHPTKDYHSESEDCQPTKRFRDALAKAEQALAATKGESHVTLQG
jgi:ABC-type Fe2+-enterobactin transport system substrate-binding protein